MKIISSIRHQVLLLFVAFTFIVTLLYVVIAVIAAFVVEDELIYQLLKYEQKQIQLAHSNSGELLKPSMSFMRLYTDKEALPTPIRQAIESGNHDHEIFTPTKEHYHFKPITLGDDNVVYLTADVSSLLVVSNSLQLFSWVYAWGLIIALIVAFLLAVKMAAVTVKPLSLIHI